MSIRFEQLVASHGFDEAENLRQNQEWYAKQEIEKREKRAIHNAMCDLRYKSAAQQREWLEQQKDHIVIPDFLEYLRPEVQEEVIQKERELIQKEEERALRKWKKEKPPLPKNLRDAEAFLLCNLSTGSLPAKKIINKAVKAGFSKRSLYRAKAKLRIRSQRLGFGSRGQFHWSLPASES